MDCNYFDFILGNCIISSRSKNFSAFWTFPIPLYVEVGKSKNTFQRAGRHLKNALSRMSKNFCDTTYIALCFVIKHFRTTFFICDVGYINGFSRKKSTCFNNFILKLFLIFFDYSCSKYSKIASIFLFALFEIIISYSIIDIVA